MLRLENISKTFERNGNEFNAVNNVSFQLEDGKILALTGHSGSGKTTLLNIISGLIKPSNGTVEIDGEEYTKLSEKEKAYFRNKNIGYILQGDSLLSNFSIIENVCLPAWLIDSKADCRERACELLDRVGLAELAGEYPENISGGEMKRVAIARALINEPKLVLADEPTGNLDPENSHIVMKLLKEISGQGTSVIFSTHEMEFLEYADMMLDIHNGNVKKEL